MAKKMGGKLGPVGGTSKGAVSSTPFKDSVVSKSGGSKR